MELKTHSSFTLSESNTAHIESLYADLCKRHSLVSGQSVIFIEQKNDLFYVTLNVKSAVLKGGGTTSVAQHGEQFNAVISEAFRKITAKLQAEKKRRDKKPRGSECLVA